MRRACIAFFLLMAGAACLPSPLSAAEEAGDELVQMIVGLLSDKDREMRSVGLQQVREEAKGPAATKRFASLLPKLPPDAQAALLDALGGRGDKTARPAVIEMLQSGDEPVRAAALGALGSLGGLADVPLLVQRVGTGAKAEKAAALRSLIRLHADGVDRAIVAELKQAKSETHARLLGALAARNATESTPAILQSAENADAAVRLAALAALRTLADPGQTPALVRLVKSAQDDDERDQAEMALVAVCSRGRDACVAPVLAGMAGAEPPARVALLRALARAGGPKALEAIVAGAKDPEQIICDEAVRLLATWPERTAVPQLLSIAKQTESLRHHVVAVQGLARLASPLDQRPADMALLAETLKVARRPQEKRIVLGVLGNIATAQSLAMLVAAMDEPALADEAGLAVLLIAEKSTDLDKTQRRAAVEKVVAKAKGKTSLERAEAMLKSLE